MRHPIKTNQFTLSEAIQIQTQQLERWKKVLKPHVYEDLARFASKSNLGITDPNQIKRGIELEIYFLKAWYDNNSPESEGPEYAEVNPQEAIMLEFIRASTYPPVAILHWYLDGLLAPGWIPPPKNVIKEHKRAKTFYQKLSDLCTTTAQPKKA